MMRGDGGEFLLCFIYHTESVFFFFPAEEMSTETLLDQSQSEFSHSQSENIDFPLKTPCVMKGSEADADQISRFILSL